ncbi:MAG: adenylosuccinate synthase [Candidatus Aminicenantes bacterium RBG_19FT_COMBO_58_17]|jgi:adenylosuccinate synthase|nr:MAG: adenylosuccinate synthase [Candidatus Aminicenantes bacterium RBG_19FT_COMBO_58_17]
MANVVVLGTQWGDEGKGKIVDLLAPSFDVIARYQGGHNAGHTVWMGGQKIVLHLIPSGILHPGKLCVIGNGVAFSPPAFLKEVAALEKLGVAFDDRLVISRNAHLILPYHPVVEKIAEERKGAQKIGTTRLGIGPSYEDKAARCGIRVGDLLDLEVFREKLISNLEEKNALFRAAGLPAVDGEEVYGEFAGHASRISRYIGDVSLLLHRKMRAGKSVLFEGAQGALLDVDHGTYPFVTSSNSTAGGVATGLGIGPTRIDEVLGVAKAYTTRVGSGPFPTEIQDDRGRLISERGSEFGATTGRPRRCGWFDALAVAYSCRINGIDRIVMTKPDILDVLEEIPVCIGYDYRGESLNAFPAEPWILEKIVPKYRMMKGWKTPIHHLTDRRRLPAAFLDYVKLIEDAVEARVCLVSTGVERKDSLLIDEELEGVVDLDRVRKELA